MWKCKAKAFKEDETIMCDWAKYYQENVQVATTEDQLLTDNMPAIHSKASLEKWTLSHCRNMWHVTQKTTAPLKGWQQTATAPEKSSTSIMGKCHFLSAYNTHIDSDIDMMLQKGKMVTDQHNRKWLYCYAYKDMWISKASSTAQLLSSKWA